MLKSKFLNSERDGTGGLLLLITSSMLAFMMIFTITLIRVSTARSVAESVEHTIALQCLASVYSHPAEYPTEQTWTANTTFPSVSKTGTAIDPLQQFNDTMKSYHFMKTNEYINAHPGVNDAEQAAANSTEKITMRYNPNDNIHGGRTHASFEIQIYDWACDNSIWSDIIKIKPNPVKVTIEDGYNKTIV